MASMENKVKKYAAKLLFQWRLEQGGISNKMRTCEESIIVIKAASSKEALDYAKNRGKDREFSDEKKRTYNQFFEFIGVTDLIELGIECEEDEVWYDVRKLLTPMERKSTLIPEEEDLNAFRLDIETKFNE